MKNTFLGLYLMAALVVFWPRLAMAADDVGQKTIAYFNTLFSEMKIVADQHPDVNTYRQLMRPVAKKIPGFFGGSFVDKNWVIRQVYHPSHFLARGFDLKKVKELDYFWKRMEEAPGPQVSEPAHGSLLQPRLISLRYPVMWEGRMAGFISMFVYTDDFLKKVGLEKVSAYRISCLGKVAEEHGKLSETHKSVKVDLPSTEWLIEYNE